MFIFLSYKKFIAGAGLLVRHQARNRYCIPQEDRGLCVSPGAAGRGGGRLSSLRGKHTACGTGRGICKLVGWTGQWGGRMGEDGDWTSVQQADMVKMQKVCFLPGSSSCPSSLGSLSQQNMGLSLGRSPPFWHSPFILEYGAGDAWLWIKLPRVDTFA